MVSGEPGRWTADEELLLNFAARGSHLRQVIKPALAQGQVVICDRFIDSSYVYQVAAGDGSNALFTQLVTSITKDAIPDITFILDIDPAIGAARAASRLSSVHESRFERKGSEFHNKVRSAFSALAAQQPKRCHLIDASGSVDEVVARIWSKLNG